jgi:nanoRNase/pAp phosphatase (c-di-AMP/oligoRNAs hydrolase)
MGIEVTPQRLSAPPSEAAAAESRFRAFLDVARGKRRPLFQLQHNPDPDALASAFALRHVWKRIFRVEPVIAYTGSVGRAENRAMMRYLKIEIRPSFKVNYRHHDFVMTVDTQPGAGTCRLPEGVVVDVVVDHHPRLPRLVEPTLSIQDVEYGATSTLVGEMLLGNGIAIPERVATALVYGIQTDTADLARNVSSHDEEVFAALYPLADHKLLGRIQRARVPESYFRAIEFGLREAQVHDAAVSTFLGEIEHPDLVAEVADLLFRLEGMSWSFVTGTHARVLYASLRCIEKEGLDAGAVANFVAQGTPKGSGGGHETLAAAQLPLAVGQTGEAAHASALERFFTATRPKRSSRRALAPNPVPPAPVVSDMADKTSQRPRHPPVKSPLPSLRKHPPPPAPPLSGETP